MFDYAYLLANMADYQHRKQLALSAMANLQNPPLREWRTGCPVPPPQPTYQCFHCGSLKRGVDRCTSCGSTRNAAARTHNTDQANAELLRRGLSSIYAGMQQMQDWRYR